jgi:glycosyltransferase involved in cell wall biosynthesis
LDRYGIAGKTVIMTSGRLDERRKGFDEILEVLPDLRRRIPDLAYLIMGDGPDRERLTKKAEELGVHDLVIFTGYVPNAKKADHYRLADVFAMPGSDKEFDSYPYRFVFLEALACGVPVVGCRLEDESEMNDPYAQKLIIQVNPNSKEEIIKGILEALPLSGRIPPELSNFYYPSFSRKVHQIIDGLPG